MENLFLIVFLVVLYGVWLGLDALQLPNTISIILVGLVVICGAFWCYYTFILSPRRQARITQEETRLGTTLTEEQKQAILPKSMIGEFLASLFGVLTIVTIFRSFIFEPFQIPSGSMEPTLRVGDFLLVEKFAYGIKDPIWQNTLIETGHPKRGDIIVFKAPPQPNVDYIKRVVGVGGDTVKFDALTRQLTVIHDKKSGEEKHVFKYSGGTPNPEFFYYGTMQLERTEQGDITHQILNNPQAFNYEPYYFKQEGMASGEWKVPKGHYFVMGDNRDNSQDSRFWGFVPEKNIVGKAVFIWLSLDKKQDKYPTGLRWNRFFTKIK
ncbi:signal peptidase I [Pasteurella atlantica]|uniref:signal peptidase I n=1 Tax=Pasteurellaceae TaxID=712 RepID=UPI00275C7FD6|nr:signal peptidase I [Pasteurella atlantica]MDP8099244.1 signal peptidase I [Pasteurella atlantica]MDP8106197.1 signal peptidase I [Pasteurella atlantica]MDP8115922.1 signal peptidase I [Pasteurella atlantica]